MKPFLTSLSLRFLLALGAVLCLALLALVLIARYQVMPILLEDEGRYAGAELDRVERAIAAELRHMERLVEDWAWWDDTYRFVQDQRPEYVASNLYESTLETLDLSLMVFVSADRRPYWVVGFDPVGDFTSCPGTQAPCDWARDTVELLLADIETGLDEDTHAWLLGAPELSLLGLSPIYGTREEAPAAGWLAMVRPVTAPWLDQLRDTTGIAMTLESLAIEAPPPAPRLERLSPTRMLASRHVAALPATHWVRIEANLPRQRYQASLETFRFALYWTGGVLIVTLIVVLLLLDRMVLRPLREFSRFTERLHREQLPASTPQALLRRRDEIGTLARKFQHLLEHQQRQQADLLILSQHDPLTGLANRRLFDARLQQSLDESSPSTADVSVLMVDIDHFKDYNDHYGHPAGDACLIALADRMKQCLSAREFLVARTGGEEFSVLLPGIPLGDGEAHAETLRLAITALALPHAASTTADIVTVSIGVAARGKAKACDPAALMRAADQALYQAKASGRNRVRVHRRASEGSPLG